MEKKYKNIYELKQLIKLHAEMNKYMRLTRKKVHDEKYDILEKETWDKLKKQSEKYGIYYQYSRLYYIAYGLLKGKKYNVIEVPRLDNSLTESGWKCIKHIMDTFPMEKYEVLEEVPTNA